MTGDRKLNLVFFVSVDHMTTKLINGIGAETFVTESLAGYIENDFADLRTSMKARSLTCSG
ncbi:hypothetical protein AB4144_52065, partial [Rhizobiaceae sp. 2RAB30]